jgi:glycosyltransferase involved in cell wall biosynthesis
MKIFGWAADTSSGCWWYRIKLPLDALRALGHDTDHGSILPPAWWDTPDVIIGQRVAKPEAVVRWKQLAEQPDRPLLVYETDDDLFNVDPGNTKAYQFFGRWDIQEGVRTCIRLADLVTVTTEPLAEQIRPMNPNVAVIPNYIPAKLLQHPLVEDPAGRTVIGWAGTHTHAEDFTEIAAELVRFVERNPMVEYHSMGLLLNGKPALFGSLKRLIATERVRLAGWFPLPHYYAALAFHIGLAPLRPSIFNRSKSPIKALEYAARGVATIASNTGPYADYIQPGVTGLLADQPHEWGRHLRDLVHDPDMRRELAANARANVRQLTIEDHVHEWAAAIHTAITGRTAPKETTSC